MGPITSQITCPTIVYPIVYSDADQRKLQSSASLAFVWGIHRGPVNSPRKWPVTRKMFPFDDVIMNSPHTNCTWIGNTKYTKSKLLFGNWTDTLHKNILVCNREIREYIKECIEIMSTHWLFADDIFQCILVNKNYCILIPILLKCVHKGLIDNKSKLVQVMAWCRSGENP